MGTFPGEMRGEQPLFLWRRLGSRCAGTRLGPRADLPGCPPVGDSERARRQLHQLRERHADARHLDWRQLDVRLEREYAAAIARASRLCERIELVGQTLREFLRA